MTYDEHDLIIDVKEITPPLPGDFKYAAKVLYLYVTDKSGRHRLDSAFPEVWGQTTTGRYRDGDFGARVFCP